jgi:glycogen phosphorylase
MIQPIFTYTVVPSLPAELDRLRDLAFNLLWSWDHDLLTLFIRLDPELWEKTQHNPVRMLGMVPQERLAALAADETFLAQLERAWERYAGYMGNSRGWYARTHGANAQPIIGYFSAEFGLTECISTYSGGLGVLSGDHLKSASDLSLPLVGTGLLYQEGYFRQYLNADGWQQEHYPDNDFYTMAAQLVRHPGGAPVTISVAFPGRQVSAQVWQLQVGRVRLYMLDTNIAGNAADDHDITDQLYGGDREMRIKQEILLGIGGYRALCAVGVRPELCHINEGHSAFLTLERCRELIRDQGLTFAEAREATSAGTVFTTHTPVPAGNDYFPAEMVERYFAAYRTELGLTRKEFLGLGRQNPNNDN